MNGRFMIGQTRNGKPQNSPGAKNWFFAVLEPSSRSNPTAFQAVRFEPPHPSDNGRDGGIQA
jgi:hypothetical protein